MRKSASCCACGREAEVELQVFTERVWEPLFAGSYCRRHAYAVNEDAHMRGLDVVIRGVRTPA